MNNLEPYKLPASGLAREQLRKKGQFWTPNWIAEAMVEYVLSDPANTIFDPAFGAGAFFRATKKIVQEKGVHIELAGMDIDSDAIEQALRYGLDETDLVNVQVNNFLFHSFQEKFSAIVANPPYIRHHRISAAEKEALRQLSLQITGGILDGRAGLHIYFLIKALSLLKDDGRLAFIMPADTCEGKFADQLWRWISINFALEAVITFSPEATPFPNVDTNPIVFLIRKAPPQETFYWAKCSQPQTDILKNWIRSGFQPVFETSLTVIRRDLDEGIQTGLSRSPLKKEISKYRLGDFVRIVRGVATGANDFFFMTAEQVKQTGIPKQYFLRAIGRTRDITSDQITQQTFDALEAQGRPTFLLALNGEPFELLPETLKTYLKTGEAVGLPQKPLISQRKPWYKMEARVVPPFLFSYLGRRKCRFIRNTAGAIPLTGFLCVYPRENSKEFLERLWELLRQPELVSNLFLIGKSYGDGAIKVEPRSLEKLPISESLLTRLGLVPKQMRLFEEKPIYKTSLNGDEEQ